MSTIGPTDSNRTHPQLRLRRAVLRCSARTSSVSGAFPLVAMVLASLLPAQTQYSRIEVETLRPDPPIGATHLGFSLGRAGSEILAGAYAQGVSVGLVRRYELSGGRLQWIGDVRSPFASQSEFGKSLTSLGNDTLYVTAARFDGVPNRLGAVVEFRRSPTNAWIQSQVVILSVNAYGMWPIATDAAQLIVGAAALVGFGPSVHIFDRDPVTGALAAGQILRGRPEVVAHGGAFGSRLELAQDVLAVAIPNMTQAGNAPLESGEVEIFRRTGGHWQLEAVLLSPQPGFARYFGHDLALSADAQRILVSEPGTIVSPYAPEGFTSSPIGEAQFGS